MGVATVTSAWLIQALMRQDLLARPELAACFTWAGSALTIAATFPVLWLVEKVLLGASEISPTLLFILHAAFIAYFVSTGWQVGRLRPRAVLVAELIRSSVLTAACLFVIYFIKWHPAEMLLLGVTTSLIAGAISIRPPIRGLFSSLTRWKDLRGLFERDATISLWFAAATILFLSDRFLLTHLVGTSAAAEYIFLADCIQRGFQLLLGPMIVSLQPVVASSLQRGRPADAYKAVKDTWMLQGGLAILVLFFAILFGGRLLRILFPDPGVGTISSFIPLLLTAAVWQLTQAIQKPLEYSGRQGSLTALLVVSITTQVLIAVYAIPHFGTPAAAWGMLIGVSFYVIAVLQFSLQLKQRLMLLS